MKANFTQQEIADYLGVERKTYADWESSKRDVKHSYIPKIAEAFGIEITDLFKEDKQGMTVNQSHYDNSSNNSIVIMLPDSDSVDKLLNVLKDRFGGKEI